ncbi:hypothetical protein EVA_17251 [gut metagenome]|uniref:Uncharacterized protein n=1 Tax=gut metagenome TaxID=749906 RepID=J9FID1_9ZZZZ
MNHYTTSHLYYRKRTSFFQGYLTAFLHLYFISSLSRL